MAIFRKLALAWSSLTLLVLPCCAQLPYNPTKIHLSSSNDGAYAYLIEPPSSSSPQGQLLSIAVSSTLRASDLSTNVITSSLPFVQDASISYTTILNADGSLMAFAGNCSAGPTGSQLWTFTPHSPVANHGAGTWTQQALRNQGQASNQGLSGANYLAAGIAFSPNTTRADTTVYIFGGMCPSSGSTVEDWASNAIYSSQMLTFEPAASSTFDFLATSSQGQPIAEAGFTITPLQPSFSIAPSGSKMQQRDFLLLGGQTQTAFINMSQVAMYSLPMALWTFLPISAPRQSATDGTAAVVEPRSGHTALLTADGTKVIVCGGWVGDTTMPASPQLAVLEVGEGYGGTGSWRWTIPSIQNEGVGPVDGMYGHGAVMLPGDIMWISGGYIINNATISSVSRRSAASTTNDYFYNVSSGSWTTTYNPKAAGVPVTAPRKSSGGLSSSQKAGLGAGIPLGLLALGFAFLGAWFYRHKKHSQRQVRHSRGQLIDPSNTDFPAYPSPHEDLVYEKSHPYSHGEEPYSPDMWGQIDAMHDNAWTTLPNPAHGPGGANLVPPPPPPHAGGWRRTDTRDATGTGLYLDLPSPKRGLRRPGPARGVYQNVAQYPQFGGDGAHAPTIIGPIEEELDEDEHDVGGGVSPASAAANAAPRLPEMTQSTPLDIFATAPVLDPFRDPEPTLPVTMHLLPHKELRRKSPFDPVDSTASAASAAAAVTAPFSNDGTLEPQRSRTANTSPERGLRSSLSFDSQHSQLSVRPGAADPTALRGKHSAPMLRPKRSGLGYSVTAASAASSDRPSEHSSQHSRPTNDASDAFDTAPNAPVHRVPRRPTRPGVSETDEPLRRSRTADAAVAAAAASSAESRYRDALSDDASDAGASDCSDLDLDLAAPSRRPSSPLRSRARLGGWVGSVRRAIPRTLSTMGARSGSGSLFISTGRANGAAGAAGTAAQTVGPDGYYYYYYTDAASDANASAASSPTKRSAGAAAFAAPLAAAAANTTTHAGRRRDHHHQPRRSVSDGASAMLSGKAKRAARDWGAEFRSAAGRRRQQDGGNGGTASSSSTRVLRGGRSWETDGSGGSGIGGSGGGGHLLLDLDDEELEAAIEDRVVQVMYTVPRERLRVVNADVDADVEADADADDAVAGQATAHDGAVVAQARDRGREAAGGGGAQRPLWRPGVGTGGLGDGR